MRDSWCSPYTRSDGTVVSGSAAREARIADQGGMDRITDRREMKGYRKGYLDSSEDTRERLDSMEQRIRDLEHRV